MQLYFKENIKYLFIIIVSVVCTISFDIAVVKQFTILEKLLYINQIPDVPHPVACICVGIAFHLIN